MPKSCELAMQSDPDVSEFAPVLGETERHWVAVGLV